MENKVSDNICPYCGAPVHPAKKTCPKCGKTQLAASIWRWLVSAKHDELSSILRAVSK